MIDLLRRAAQSTDRAAAIVLHEAGLTPRQLTILEVLMAGEMASKDVADATSIDRSTVSNVIHTLINRGLVEKFDQPEDRRTFMLKLTRSGKAKARAGQKRLVRLEDALSEGATKKVIESIQEITERAQQVA